jgi:hypothetical protein
LIDECLAFGAGLGGGVIDSLAANSCGAVHSARGRDVEDVVGHVFVCLFVVVDMANIQALFAYPSIHAKKVCIHAR